MQKRIFSLLLALTVCLALVACTAEPAAPAVSCDMAEAYELEKINDLSDMVLARQIVPQDYLRYLDEPLMQLVEQYNAATAQLRLFYTDRAAEITRSLFYEQQENPGDYAHSELYFEWIGRISHYALYENAAELCANDPYLSYPLAKEAGGSWGMWAARIHEDVSADIQQQTRDYFTLVGELLTGLEDARGAQTQTNDKD